MFFGQQKLSGQHDVYDHHDGHDTHTIMIIMTINLFQNPKI